MRKQTVYKAVKVEGPRLRSWLFTHHKDFSLDYAIGQRTRARRGTFGVLVFKTLEEARWFVKNEGFEGRPDAAILECDGYGEPFSVLALTFSVSKYLFGHFRRRQIIDRFNHCWGKNYRSDEAMSAPRGTFSVESVIPRRVVA